MAEHITHGLKVLDLGCGKMWLETMVKCSEYIPVDYISRDSRTIVCDFNRKQFPNVLVDVTFASGVIEYVNDVKWFVGEMSSSSKKIIISYVAMEDFGDVSIRRSRGWVNHLTKRRLLKLFEEENYMMLFETVIKGNSVFVFERRN